MFKDILKKMAENFSVVFVLNPMEVGILKLKLKLKWPNQMLRNLV